MKNLAEYVKIPARFFGERKMKMLKKFNKTTTDIICYFSAPGWLIALIFGDYEKSKVHINQAMVIGMLSLMSEFAFIIARMFFKSQMPLGIAAIIYDILRMLFMALSIIGVFRAIRKNDTPMPVVGHIKILP